LADPACTGDGTANARRAAVRFPHRPSERLRALAHVRATVPGGRIALGGPGKTDEELAVPVDRLHVESPNELRRLLAAGLTADILLRLNLEIPVGGAALTMGGAATPFGMDSAGAAECLSLLAGQDRVRLRGVHAHLASGLDAADLLGVAAAVLDHARPQGHTEVNLGGGMADGSVEIPPVCSHRGIVGR
jgi:diaminopimelate decarboxylase